MRRRSSGSVTSDQSSDFVCFDFDLEDEWCLELELLLFDEVDEEVILVCAGFLWLLFLAPFSSPSSSELRSRVAWDRFEAARVWWNDSSTAFSFPLELVDEPSGLSASSAGSALRTVSCDDVSSEKLLGDRLMNFHTRVSKPESVFPAKADVYGSLQYGLMRRWLLCSKK